MAVVPNALEAQLAHLERAERRWERGAPDRNEADAEIDKMRRGEPVEWQRLDLPSRVRERLARLGLREEASALLDAPSQSFNPAERIIAENQLAGVEFFERGLVAARAVARIEIRGADGFPEGYGTGVMISPSLMLTNNHVLSSAASAAASFAQFEYVKSVSGPRDPLSFSFRPDRFFETDAPLDFTVLAVEPVNAAGVSVSSRGWCPLSAESGKAIVGERVNIVQHPAGERMQIAVRDNTIVGVVDAFLHYRTDTRRGSSGSPVFNDQWEMAALHHSGVPRSDDQGRLLLVDGRIYDPARWDGTEIDFIANEGVRISRIVEAVERRRLVRDREVLWRGAFKPAEPLDVWGLFNRPGHERTGTNPTSDERGPELRRDGDANGDASWLFRLSFGPVGSTIASADPRFTPGAHPAPNGRRSAAGAIEAPPVVLARAGVDPEALARELLERYADVGPYLDEAADEARRQAYWNGVDLAANSAELFAALHSRLVDTHRPIEAYQKARLVHLYPSVDRHEDKMLRNLYSGTTLDPAEALASEIAALERLSETERPRDDDDVLESDAAWSALEAGPRLVFNCEHVVCQSWFDAEEPMRSDLHHLFACEPRCNSFRSNIPYWSFPPESEAVMAECGRREGRTKFEPVHGKGPAARATMYFLMRYPGQVGDEDGELPKSRAKLLLDWHAADPPSRYERHRNDRIQTAQGNRNPFIDFPSSVTLALLGRGFDRPS